MFCSAIPSSRQFRTSQIALSNGSFRQRLIRAVLYRRQARLHQHLMLNGGLSRKNRIIAFTTPIRIRDSIVAGIVMMIIPILVRYTSNMTIQEWVTVSTRVLNSTKRFLRRYFGLLSIDYSRIIFQTSRTLGSSPVSSVAQKYIFW